MSAAESGLGRDTHLRYRKCKGTNDNPWNDQPRAAMGRKNDIRKLFLYELPMMSKPWNNKYRVRNSSKQIAGCQTNQNTGQNIQHLRHDPPPPSMWSLDRKQECFGFDWETRFSSAMNQRSAGGLYDETVAQYKRKMARDEQTKSPELNHWVFIEETSICAELTVDPSLPRR